MHVLHVIILLDCFCFKIVNSANSVCQIIVLATRQVVDCGGCDQKDFGHALM